MKSRWPLSTNRLRSRPVGGYAILDATVDPRFLDTKNRPALAQTFQDNETGGIFTVVVNHLKSKGSSCDDVGDPDTGDGAGNCNLTRTLAAQALVDWLATDPTGSGDPDFLIIGDLNAYDKEDPIDAILAGADDLPGSDDDYADLLFQILARMPTPMSLTGSWATSTTPWPTRACCLTSPGPRSGTSTPTSPTFWTTT